MSGPVPALAGVLARAAVRERLGAVIGRAVAPRKPLTVSEWADANRHLSAKDSPEAGQWHTSRNPTLREPMDCFSTRSTVRDVVLMFPIQFGKTQIALNVLGYCMDHDPGPVMYALPGEVSMNKWIDQKFQPTLDETPAMSRALSTTNSRDASNRREFKDFIGGQLYIEHAGSPSRLKSTSVRTLIVDELDEFASTLRGGDDPLEMLKGRTSAFRSTYRRLYISTPQLQGVSRTGHLWDESDQRRYHVPCPHCEHEQPLEWGGLHWSTDATECWYACRECGATIEEHHKDAMIARGRWVATYPDRKTRGYHLNALYYPMGLGPRWLDLVEMWRDAQGDPAKLKVFVNDRLAELYEDPAMRAVKHNVIADRAEPYKLRTAPLGVLALTAGVDTQDNRLAVHVVGWGRRLAAWTLDYVELPGDPAEEAVWLALVDLLNRPIEHASGTTLRPLATAIDAGGHRTEAVKAFVRARRIPRPMAIFGAKANNAPILSKARAMDVNWLGRTDRNGVMIHHVGSVAAKHWLYARLSTDAEKADADQRLVHFPDELDEDFFGGMVSEVFKPDKGRFEKRRGAKRNEPLDTWVYAYAAAHHPEVRLHRFTHADWDAADARLRASAAAATSAAFAGESAAASAPVDVDPLAAAEQDRLARFRALGARNRR
ncbi:phage terminase large subunit family protein [Flagellatimonas centrodinii]|uniref:phage terminase large subunit family protein n=1 Tax=Flagellatimonas centrodinii TaxID=2806210 RepID=UPI001FEFD656|nr:phage terminase large subunit family protein [Flagellatimonas centrodinii]ULQ45955.1 phage terminase large subunit family protein [Flagellatimonas centrodinii]